MTALYRETLSRNGFQFVEKLLYERKRYNTALQELESELATVLQRLDDIYPVKAQSLDGMPHGTGTSSPTENFAVKKADNLQVKYLQNRIDEMKRHEKAISEALIYMTDTEKLLIKLKYDREKTAKECMKEMHIEKTRWYEMRQEIIYKIASYLGIC